MARVTKKEAAARKAAWTLALAEGRVVAFKNPITKATDFLTSYPSIEARDAAVAKAKAGGSHLPEIVNINHP